MQELLSVYVPRLPLYLFIGQALIRFLLARGLGVAVAGMRMAGFQFADDLTALLTDSLLTT